VPLVYVPLRLFVVLDVSPGVPVTFSQFLSVLEARWRSALVVWCTVVGLVLGLSLLTPKQYTASSSVLVDIKAPDPVLGNTQPSSNVTTTSVMATQMDVMQSERVVSQALKAMKLTDSQPLRDKWQSVTGGEGSFETWMAVAYTSPDPKVSANLVNAIVRAYIDTTLELKVNPARQYNNFFDERAKELRAALETAQGKLSAFQQSKGLLATDERVDIENTRLNELVSQLVALQAVAAESGSRTRQARADGNLQEVLSSPMVTNLSMEVSRQETKLKELSERLGPNHPQVQELQATLSTVRSQLIIEKSKASASVGVNNRVNQQRLAQLTQSVDEQRAKVLTLKGQRDEAAVLLRDIESAQRSYDAVLTRANQAELESRNTQTNLAVLKTATPPPSPSSPQIWMNVSVAAVLGALLAVIVALGRERLDPRLRSETDVLEGLMQTMLVVLPKSSQRTAQGRTRLQSTKTRVVTGLPRPAN
jgi:polysaccharide biosynthesis transport protein